MKSVITTISIFFVFLVAAQTEVKFSPVVIPVTDAEILNSGRGLARWQARVGSIPYAYIDNYYRIKWVDVEPTQGVYDFSKLDIEADIAKNNVDGRGIYGLAVRCIDSGIDYGYPAYLNSKMTGWYSAAKKCWVPDWNSPYFLERQDSMVAALGRKYNNDTRVGFIDIRSYGNWGEWHLSGFETPPAPLTTVTTATIQHMIDTYIKAFPDKQLIMLSDNATGLDYAMSKTNTKYPIGWRRDSWGSPLFDNVKKTTTWSKASERWKTAPVIIESIDAARMEYDIVLNQIIDYHISSIQNTNIVPWSTLSQGAKDSLLSCVKSSGFRYIIRSVNCPAVFVPGQTINLKSEWSNVGNAPIYRDWKVTYRITNQTSGAVVLEIPSTIDLRKLLPTYSFATTIDVPVLFNDFFVLPANFSKGNYNLEIIVTDPTNYLAPLKLAILGRKTSGAYGLGTIGVDTQSAVNELTFQNDFFWAGISNSEIKLTFQTAGVYSYSVFNLEGKAVLVSKSMNFNIGDYFININDLPKGFYILKIYKDNTSKSIRFVK